jgi:hypothetical protein
MSAGLLTAAVRKDAREVKDFRAIHNRAGIDVYFSTSASHSVVVETDEKYIDRIVTESENGVLTVKWKKEESGFNSFLIFNRKERRVKVNVYVSAPNLTEIHVSGNADFNAEKVSSSSDFNMKLSGRADGNIRELEVDGSVRVSASGATDCSILSVTTRNGDFLTSGAANINVAVNASGTVSGSASGASGISVSGNAGAVKAFTSGNANIDVRRLVHNHISSGSSGRGNVLK